MNFPLSELVSWVLEPLASAMEDSGKLVNGEDLKSNIDGLNEANKSWVPQFAYCATLVRPLLVGEEWKVQPHIVREEWFARYRDLQDTLEYNVFLNFCVTLKSNHCPE